MDLERVKAAFVLMYLAAASVTAHAEPVTVPTYDIAKTCRILADYAFAATLGEVDVPREIEICSARERTQKGSVEALWPLASGTDRSECLNLAEDRYGYLARCLAASRSVRASR